MCMSGSIAIIVHACAIIIPHVVSVSISIDIYFESRKLQKQKCDNKPEGVT